MVSIRFVGPMLAVGPYKCFLSLQQPIYVSPRRDEGIAHDRMFIYEPRIIKCSVGNGLPSDNPIESIARAGAAGTPPRTSIETRQGPGGLR